MMWLWILVGVLGGAVLLARAATTVTPEAGSPSLPEPAPEPAPVRPGIPELARAIAKAEGFFQDGTLPARYHNPGDITDGRQVRRFETDEQGWDALYDLLDRILTGDADYLGYSPSMSIREMALVYTGGDKPEAWAQIVARELRVSADRPLSEVVG